MPIIETRSLTYIYSRGTPFEKKAIDRVSLSIEQGETIGIIGHTGSGKSTLIQHMNALLKPSEGRVLLRGEDIFASKASMREARRHVGLVFQYPEYQLFEETVYADIAFGPRNMKLSEAEVDERVREAAAFTGVTEDMFGKSPLELSGGRKRRVAIAGVLAMRPEILILDEPAAGLDPAGRRSIFANILAWKKASGATLLIVTHDMSAAASLCSRLIVMDDGHVAFDGSCPEVFSHAEQLRAMGLDLPASADMALRLRQRGVALPPDIYTPEALTSAILSLWGGDDKC